MTFAAPALLCLALTTAAEPIKLASPGLAGLNLAPEALSFYSEHLAQQVRFAGPKVLTAGDIGAVLGIERQKQLMGCSDNGTACTVELANALGVDGVIVGHLAKLGSTYQLDVHVLAAKDGEALAARSAKAASEEALVAEMDRLAPDLVDEVYRRLGREPPPRVAAANPEPAPKVQPVAPANSAQAAPPSDAPVAGNARTGADGSSTARVDVGPTDATYPRAPAGRRGPHPAWIPAVGGLVISVVGFVVLGVGVSQINEVRDSDRFSGQSIEFERQRISDGAVVNDVGAWMIAAGVAAGTGAIIWRIAGRGEPRPVEAAVTAGPSGVSVSVGGALP